MQTRERLAHTAQATLRRNDRGGYTLPTDGLYPFQWNWDAGVTALGWMRFDPRARLAGVRHAVQWPVGTAAFWGRQRRLSGANHLSPRQRHLLPGPDQWGTGSLALRTSTISQPPCTPPCCAGCGSTAQRGLPRATTPPRRNWPWRVTFGCVSAQGAGAPPLVVPLPRPAGPAGLVGEHPPVGNRHGQLARLGRALARRSPHRRAYCAQRPRPRGHFHAPAQGVYRPHGCG